MNSNTLKPIQGVCGGGGGAIIKVINTHNIIVCIYTLQMID